MDILQPDICACGGFSEASRIAALASTWGLTVYPRVWGSAVGLHASVHWAASLPANLFRERVAVEPLRRDGAIIEVPQRPGLGLEVDRALRERYAVTTGESKQ